VLLDADAWDAGHRHAEELLARIADLLARAGVARPGPGSLSGVVVGTGPGGFTGLRVGLATARGIARVAAAPLVGIPTGVALAAAAGRNPSGATQARRLLPSDQPSPSTSRYHSGAVE
jgi:tRNA threonylcarbamoyl adenosine modification protein YeaZ